MKITTIGVDLAKAVFAVHGVNARGKVALKRQLKRAQVLTFFVNLGPASLAWRPVAVPITGPGN